MTSYLTLYGKETGLMEAASYFFLIHSISVICSRPFTGKVIDSRGANIVVYPCILLFATGMFIYSRSTATWMVLLAAACMGLGFGNFNSAAQMIAVKNAEPSRLGHATATYFMFLDLGFGLGPYILGHIIEGVGFRLLYLLASCIALICMPVYYNGLWE
ncbi:MFS transporter [Ureibacillus terrenus]|uniref:MFS transporter n=1 Tax=Ureibacillus terrenus TaxID=118246 RepID=UPI0015EF9E1D|nr:MFS transporter [Ureibacillus terrenus]MED3764422.1 MFS transporter [Ureibacillus terrenus]